MNKKAKGKDYLTDKEFDEAVRRYHNGLDFTEHIQYKDSIIADFIHKEALIEEYLEPGEEYTRLSNSYAMTSYGRVFNLRFRRWLKPKFYNSDIYIFFQNTSNKCEPVFEEMGWDYDKVEILRRYIKNDWSKIINPNCQYASLV